MNRHTFAEYQRLRTEALRKPGLSNQERARLFRDAAALALPARCRGQACESDASACPSRHRSLSREERRDCLNRLWAQSNASKQEAQAAVRLGGPNGFRAALPKWIDAENAGAAAATLDPTPPQSRHWRYLAYWRCVTAAQLALHEADFPKAREAFTEAGKHAEHLHDQLYPFSGPSELAAVGIYIDGVAFVKAGRFTEAAESFERWLTLFRDRHGTHDLRFDSVRANHLACVVLGRILSGDDCTESLDSLTRHLRNTSVSLPTWTLYRRVQTIAAAAQLLPDRIGSVIDTDSPLWTLFLLLYAAR